MPKTTIPVAICKRILKKYAELVSYEASIELSKGLTEIAEEVSEKAFIVMKHLKRKTIKASDVKFAFRK